MALVKCDECGKEISSTADKCPHCGAKPAIKRGCGCWTLTIIIGICVLVYLFSPPGKSPRYVDSPNIQVPSFPKSKEGGSSKPLLGNIWIGTELYLKSDNKYIGRVTDIESNHLFPNGSKGEGVKIDFAEGGSFWMPRDGL